MPRFSTAVPEEESSLEYYASLYEKLKDTQRRLDFLEAVINELPNPVFVKNSEAKFCFFNKAYEEFFNIRREDMLNQSVLDCAYLSPESRERYQREDLNAIRNGSIVHYETEYDIEPRGACPALYWSKGICSPHFHQRGLVGTIVDISEQTRLARELNRRVDELEQARQNLSRLSQTDPLTGLLNRRTFEERLGEYVAIANRHEQPLCLLMGDLDNFKGINDLFGHDVGDAALKCFADILRQNCRSGDTFARFGGDEFICLLPLTRQHDARCLAERIRHATEGTRILPDGSLLTTSLGVAEYKLGENPGQFKKRADIALYRAKRAGRNTVMEYT